MFPSALLVSRTYREENEGEWSLLLTFAIVSSTPVLNFIRPLLLHHAYRTVFTRYYLIQIPQCHQGRTRTSRMFLREAQTIFFTFLEREFSKTLRIQTKILLLNSKTEIGSEISNNKKVIDLCEA